MSDFICFTQYFVNKQNVRSFSNILNLKLFKSENSEAFLQEIFQGEKLLVNELSVELKELLYGLQKNVKLCSRQDFKNYFVIEDHKKILVSLSKEIVVTYCWNALNEIIPKELIDSNYNKKLLKKCITAIIFSMNRQHLDLKKLLQKWDFEISLWRNMSVTFSAQVLHIILKWILRHVLSAMISLNFYVTTCKTDNDENKLHFFWKYEWQRFYDRKVSEMVSGKIIQKFDPYCLGNKIKRKHSALDKIKLRILKKDTPKLHLILKPNNECRPIVRYKNDANMTDKHRVKERFYFLRKLIGKTHEKIEIQFPILFKNWTSKGKPKLFFVKTDLSNAFGSINRQNLLHILCECHSKLQKTEESWYMKKKHAEHYKEMIGELRKPLLIRTGSTVYEWKEGLIQGYKYSPALSELYYSYLDEVYFSEHLKRQHELRLFIRVVDDYLYITESLEDAHLFLKSLSNYRNINYGKTVVNFAHQFIGFSKEITFLGYSYNTESLQVRRANAVYSGQICYKIVFSAAVDNLEKFLENRIGQAGIQISNHIFNFHHNSEELIWEYIFLTLCLSANKFCTILAILCDEKEMVNFLSVYKRKVSVKLCNTLIDTLEKNRPENFLFVYCINHFRYLSYKALLLCARKTQKCNILVPHINGELAKANCVYGKWKEHSSRIDKSGKSQKLAIRDICRRTDLRLLFNNFNELPLGVQCYDHRFFYK